MRGSPRVRFRAAAERSAPLRIGLESRQNTETVVADQEMTRRTFQKGTSGMMSTAAIVAMVMFGLVILIPFGLLLYNWFG